MTSLHLSSFRILWIFHVLALFSLISRVKPNEETANPFKFANKWIEIVNNDPNSTWTAGQNFDPNLPAGYIKKLLGLKSNLGRRSTLRVREPIDCIDDKRIPKSFDARKKWKHCKSLHDIRDQGDCGSCWAVSAASVFSDRVYIATKGKFNSLLSSEELVSCCTSCGDGCNGGYDDLTWEHINSVGIVTGGDYNSSEGCQPYSLQPCEHHVSGSRPNCADLEPTYTPKCQRKCTNKNYKHPFNKDHRKAKEAYLIPKSEKEIQKDIMKYGPVQAGFYVYYDFLTYKKGVYKHSPHSQIAGGHAVKVIGWGVSRGTPYWLVQNSWNKDWGDKGLFKILRGHNECDFESEVYAGIPDV